YKPQPAVYLNAAELLDLGPAQCLMVAAHNDDLIAAAGWGLATAFVVRPQEHGPGQRSDLEPEQRFDYHARDFHELADQLGCP
ncbi:MAG: HAD hydrolase-like protein, partial [Candidatus Competibacterales bacterium]|nr:HAD hydrolase-like protein [Candidatus Competibacterales bacterium]